MRFTFDPEKSKRLKQERGASLEEAQALFFGPHCVNHRSDDPEQFIAIGWIQDRLYSVIFEERQDPEGDFYHLVTLWKATAVEEKIYEREKH